MSQLDMEKPREERDSSRPKRKPKILSHNNGAVRGKQSKRCWRIWRRWRKRKEERLQLQSFRAAEVQTRPHPLRGPHLCCYNHLGLVSAAATVHHPDLVALIVLFRGIAYALLSSVGLLDRSLDFSSASSLRKRGCIVDHLRSVLASHYLLCPFAFFQLRAKPCPFCWQVIEPPTKKEPVGFKVVSWCPIQPPSEGEIWLAAKKRLESRLSKHSIWGTPLTNISKLFSQSLNRDLIFSLDYLAWIKFFLSTAWQGSNLLSWPGSSSLFRPLSRD